jgi:hypothetical protein
MPQGYSSFMPKDRSRFAARRDLRDARMHVRQPCCHSISIEIYYKRILDDEKSILTYPKDVSKTAPNLPQISRAQHMSRETIAIRDISYPVSTEGGNASRYLISEEVRRAS